MSARRRQAIGFGIAGIALALVGAAAGAGPKETLTVAITGKGTVSAHPSGIHCTRACTLRAPKGEKITLAASPDSGQTFSHWGTPCGTSPRCTIRLTRSRTIHAYFAQSAPPPGPTSTPTPTPPPPPPAKPGHYVGSYSDGSSPFTFDISSDGTGLTNLSFDFNGHCSDQSTMASDLLQIDGTFPIGTDGSVSGHITLTFTNASGTADFSGMVTSSGSGSGTMNVSITFSGGGASCTSTGNWTAQDQS